MPKKCSPCPDTCITIKKNQKLLLKILNCLWNQYITNRTTATKIFFANPNPLSTDVSGNTKYTNMLNELTLFTNLINSNEALKVLSDLDPSGIPAYARIIACDANGIVAVDTSSSTNTYDDYLANTVNSTNQATNKNIQNLNVNECLSNSVQVKPVKTSYPDSSVVPTNTFVTEASVSERSGCAGVSNTGFITLSIEANINVFCFNSCVSPCLKCY